MNSREQIMEMVKEGTLSVEEGLRLLEALEESERRHKEADRAQRPLITPGYSSSTKPKMLKIFVESADHDRVRVNVPVALLRAGLDFTRQIEMSGIDMNLKGVDLDLVLRMVEEGQVGELVDVVSAEGDKVQIFVE